MSKFNLICQAIKETKNLGENDTDYILVSDFDNSDAESFYKKFMKLHADRSVQIIPIIVNSYGGQVHNLLAMLDVINSSEKPVATIAMGKAMSCGAFLLASGTKGYRFAAPNTDIMIHEVSSMEWGKTSDIENGSRHTKSLNSMLFKHLAKAAGIKDTKYFLTALKKQGNVDWYLSADQFKRLKLIDYVAVPNLIKV